MTDTNRPLRVFLCHSSADKPAVRELYQKLTERGIDAWLDEKKLLPGQKWKIEIPKAVRQADAVIICLSKTSITKEGYVQKEIKFALDFALEKPDGIIYLIPAKFEECEVPESLSDWQWVNLFESQGIDFIFKSLQYRANSLGLSIKQISQHSKGLNSLFDKAVKIAQDEGSISPSMLQEKLRITRSTASRFIDMMEEKGIIGSSEERSQLHKVMGAQKKSDELVSAPVSEKELPRTESVFQENKITISNGMEFMRVPAGKFLMGSDDGDRDERPKNVVDIPYEYWMARYSVTNEQYNLYVRSVGQVHPVWNWENKKEHPVVSISWDTVMEYCKWLNNLFRVGLPSKMMIRLPTEAEWEKAARGADGREYPWGNSFDINKCNSSEGRKGETTSVGSYSPQGDSPYGCADMAGNVWEWVHSIYEPYIYNANDGRESEQNIGVSRVLRSGSFQDSCKYSRCAHRGRVFTNYHHEDVGFRVVIAPHLPK